MRIVTRALQFAIVVGMSTFAASQTLTPPQAITDPKQITAKPDAEVEQGEESLSLSRLYMTRLVGDTAWSPDGKTIVFQSDYDGDEQWDIFFVSPKTGQVVNVTKTREIAEENPTWSPDGRYLAYMVKPKTSSSYEIDVFDTVLREVKHVTSGTPADKLNTNPIWSKDGKFIVYTQEEAKGTNSNIFIAEVATGKSTLLTPHEGERLYAANDFSRDGKILLITSNADN